MSLALLDWRRRVAALYAEVRATADPETAWRRWRAGRDELFRTHPESPVVGRSSFEALPFAPYDAAMRFVVPVAPASERRLTLDTGDGPVALDRIGTVSLGGLGRLDVWWLGGYGGGIFLPFRDATNGIDTYGGGRYVLDTVKGADLGGDGGRLVIDLNFAYHPSCAYDARWSCPLAPDGNRLAVPVRAGELTDA